MFVFINKKSSQTKKQGNICTLLTHPSRLILSSNDTLFLLLHVNYHRDGPKIKEKFVFSRIENRSLRKRGTWAETFPPPQSVPLVILEMCCRREKNYDTFSNCKWPINVWGICAYHWNDLFLREMRVILILRSSIRRIGWEKLYVMSLLDLYSKVISFTI